MSDQVVEQVALLFSPELDIPVKFVCWIWHCDHFYFDSLMKMILLIVTKVTSAHFSDKSTRWRWSQSKIQQKRHTRKCSQSIDRVLFCVSVSSSLDRSWTGLDKHQQRNSFWFCLWTESSSLVVLRVLLEAPSPVVSMGWKTTEKKLLNTRADGSDGRRSKHPQRREKLRIVGLAKLMMEDWARARTEGHTWSSTIGDSQWSRRGIRGR